MKHVHMVQQMNMSRIIFCSGNPHSFGNFFLCGLSSIIDIVEVVKGMDYPKEMPISKFEIIIWKIIERLIVIVNFLKN